MFVMIFPPVDFFENPYILFINIIISLLLVSLYFSLVAQALDYY
nr:MAG TPA: hypothetical protein [Caudoviricetes sp.]